MALDPITQSLLSITEDDVTRATRYQRAWQYYRAEEYLTELGQEYVKERKLFRHMRRVFGYVTQVVDTDARFVMREKLGVDAEEDLATDILAMWERSNFQSEKYKFARFGCNLGDCYLIVSDLNGGNGRVVPRLVVANTEDMTIWRDPDDQTQVLRARQSYNFLGEDGKTHTRTWLYYPDVVERYTDDRMDDGFPRPHPFGEVPVVHVKPIDIGEAFGLCSWHQVQGQLDEVNELGSYSNRILLRYADPTLIVKGAIAPAENGQTASIRKGAGGENVFFLPTDQGDMKILEYQGNALPHIIEQIDHIADNIKDQLPELSLAKIREQSGLSGYAVSLHCAELIAKIAELRGNFANGIEWANALALRAMRRSRAPLEEFANHVRFEPVLPEDLVERNEVEDAEQEAGILSRRERLRRRGLTEQEIDARFQEIEEERRRFAFGIDRLQDELNDANQGGQGEGNDDQE